MRFIGVALVGLVGCGPAVDSGTGGASSASSGVATSTSGASTTTSAEDPSGAAASTTADEGSSGPGTSTGAVAVPPPATCSCDTTLCPDEVIAACDGDRLCPPLEVTCARPQVQYGCQNMDVVVDREAMECALRALSQRIPGVLTITEETEACGLRGCGQQTERIYILDGLDSGNAVVASCTTNPLAEATASTSLLRVLEAPKEFAACGELRTAAAQLDCLRAGLGAGSVLACE